VHSISNAQIYLQRLSKPLAEKLVIAKFIKQEVSTILDVGCADGAITASIADLFPNARVTGIDLNQDFIKIAQKKWKDKNNLNFENIYLRELLARQERFDSVIFCSVLHEFYSYGEGISSVLKALADAHELLKPHGRIIIRDMILYKYTKEANLFSETIIQKIRRHEDPHYIADFENQFGPLNEIHKINHYLLKYWYKENWERESKENYVPVTFEEYNSIFSLLGMKIQFEVSYTIPFLEQKWKEDFRLDDDEIKSLRSTGIIVAEKN